MPLLPVDKPWLDHGYIDAIRVEPCGLICVIGWSRRLDRESLAGLSLYVNEELCPAAGHFLISRPDVAADGRGGTGFCMEYQTAVPRLKSLRLICAANEKALHKASLDIPCYVADYAVLRETASVYHRDQIYGYGPPSPAVTGEALFLLRDLAGRVLDFGCGMGALVSKLRERGVDAHGLELDRPEIHRHLLAPVKPFVTLYDGRFPAPYADRSYDHVVCCEVLEHIPDYEAALAEMARITRQTLLLTVPDIAAIPALHRHGVVPWHLLESTHVNFFTQKSLESLLARYFRSVQILKIHPAEINGTLYWNNLAAICSEAQ
jgi:2-polyprenyl-3-methyl-5-hydroxy-6-metoxy-1,4-benzoquinol methylase